LIFNFYCSQSFLISGFSLFPISYPSRLRYLRVSL
jgi:hypothetical protein